MTISILVKPTPARAAASGPDDRPTPHRTPTLGTHDPIPPIVLTVGIVEVFGSSPRCTVTTDKMAVAVGDTARPLRPLWPA